jgi:PASTA domain
MATAKPAAPSSGSDFLKKKVGPFPVPVLIGAGLLAGYWVWSHYFEKKSTTTTAATTSATSAGTVSGSYSSRTWSTTTPPTSSATTSPTTSKTTTGTVTVPDCIGDSAAESAAKIGDAGLTAKFVDARSHGVGYTVTSQNPSAGSKAPKGSTVNLHTEKTTTYNAARAAAHPKAAPKKTPRKKT